MSTINKVEKDGIIYDIAGSGGGKNSFERFITFDKHFDRFNFTEDVENFSVVGQIAHARYWYRTKATRHGIRINSWTSHRDGRGDVEGKNKGEKYFRTCSRNSFSAINHEENYCFEATDPTEQQPYEIIDNIFKYWFGSDCTGYTPNEFLPVFKIWGAAEVLENLFAMKFKYFKDMGISGEDNLRPLLYSGDLDNFNFDDVVSGRFYLVPIDPEDPGTIEDIDVFDLDAYDLYDAIDSGFLSGGNKRISVKLIKNIEIVRDEEEGYIKYWTGKMNFASLYIRGSFRCINNNWYMCYYVMPDVVEKPRY